MTTSPRLGMTDLEQSNAIPEMVVNANERILEQAANRWITKDKDLATPPGSPTAGDAYIIAASPTGAWAGHATHLTWYENGAWRFVTPIEGTAAYLQDEDKEYRFNGTAWAIVSQSHRGALVTLSADENTANYSTAHPIAFATETRDTDSIHPYSSTVTITIASPGVITWTGHTLKAGSPVVFTTTGALPTGLTAGTTYYVISAGLGANSFQVSATPGGSAVNTSGSQSGTHTATNYSRLIVPSGITKVWLKFNVLLTNVTANTDTQVQILKNGTGGFAGTSATAESNSGTSPRWSGFTAVLDVTGGDAFDLELGCSDTSISVLANYTWFEMIIVE